MSKRVLVIGALSAGMLAVGAAGTASANVQWCVSDPPIPVVTPAGQHLMVNNMIYLASEDRHLASEITDDASTAPDGHGGTLITIHVYLPVAHHGANVVSNNYRFRVSDTSSAPGGWTMVTLSLDVPTP